MLLGLSCPWGCEPPTTPICCEAAGELFAAVALQVAVGTTPIRVRIHLPLQQLDRKGRPHAGDKLYAIGVTARDQSVVVTFNVQQTADVMPPPTLPASPTAPQRGSGMIKTRKVEMEGLQALVQRRSLRDHVVRVL